MDRNSAEALRRFLDNYRPDEMVCYPFSTRNALLRNPALTRELVPPAILVMLILEGILPDNLSHN